MSVKSFDERFQFPTDMTAILGENTHCQFGVPCESLLSFTGRRYNEGRKEMYFINIYRHNSEILLVWFQTAMVK